MRKRTGLVVLALVMCAAVSAQGLGLGGMMGGPGTKFLSEFKPVVGAWAEYRTTMKDEDPSTVRVAIVGKEGEAYWHEVVTAAGQGSNLVVKMLVSGNPQDPQNVTRMITKMNDEPAVEMPVTGMAPPPTTGETDVPKQPDSTVVNLGIESATVPAGTFQAMHIQYTEEDVVVDTWVASGIGPYGVVKMTSGDAETALTAYGSDATTRITETPTKFEMPMMPFGMPKGQ